MPKQQSLLDKAKSIEQQKRRQRTFSEDEIELALAFVNSDINMTQVQMALGHKTCNATYPWIVQILLHIIRSNIK